MKKRFLPFSLLLVIMVLGQSMAIADNGGHYVPRTQGNETAESFMRDLRVNQQTGLIDPAWLLQAQQSEASRNMSSDNLYWISMGPDNMGGQTTAVVYDNTLNASNHPNGVVYIGSKGGGVYKTYNLGVTWHQVGNKDLMVSCMTQDENGIIYVGTGDGGSAAKYNGFDQQNYENSFIGTGIYTIDARHNDAMEILVAPTENEWNFINDLVCFNGGLLAATDEGLKYYKNQQWEMVLEGRADEVKTGNNLVVASVDGMIYIGTNLDNMECHSASGITMQGDTLIPTAAGLLDIAIAPTDENIIYASCIGTDGVHSGIYVTRDKGATWAVALPAVSTTLGDYNNVYSSYGLNNHGIVVDPTNSGRVFILGYCLFKIEEPTGDGYYISENLTSENGGTINQSDYLHVGLHVMTFNPNNSNEFYVGTDGGVFKGTRTSSGMSFYNCNRNYVTSRMFNVAYSNTPNRILAAGLDHGTVKIEGDPTSNTLGYGEWINPAGYNLGAYAEAAQAGPCIFSMINTNSIFVTYKGGGLKRSETAGADWVSTNFPDDANDENPPHPLSISTSSFRLPIALYEDFDDPSNPDTAWFKNNKDFTYEAGATIQIMSNNNYPFDYVLTEPLVPGDSIGVQDPVSARMYVAFTNTVAVTRGALRFDSAPDWYKLATTSNGFSGEPLCLAVSDDGDNLFVGTKAGRLFRLSNLNTVVDAATGTIGDSLFTVTNTEITLPTSGQCITSIAIDPKNANKVLVTLGNYGNDDYVLYSTNALSDNPTFVSKQGVLPKMPVYSSVIAYDYSVNGNNAVPHFILGTERGIYSADANFNWTADSHLLGEVPVMDLKQQTHSHVDQFVTLISPQDTVVNVYPGIYNRGIIYAATYGKGVFRCENFKDDSNSGAGVPENPIAVESNVELYPNPVRDAAVVRFEVEDNANVSYQVFDMNGRMVMNQNLGRFAKGSHEINVNMGDLSTGSYIMRFSQGTSSSCVKFLVY